MELAPILLFTYNRLSHTKKTVEALQKNVLAPESVLYIYSDGAKGSQEEKVTELRTYLKTIKGFKKIHLLEQPNNKGLAKSIIDGVTEVINKYGCAIILEDDMISSQYFLKYMNDSLTKYKNDSKVWHISGWNYPINFEGLDDSFFWRTMNCWGWGTWKDRWIHFEKNPKKLIKEFSRTDIKEFDLQNTAKFWEQVLANENGKLNTWAIFWYATIFKNKGYCLNPTESFILNIGHDGSGTNSMKTAIFDGNLCQKDQIQFPKEVEVNQLAYQRIVSFYESTKLPFLTRLKNKLSQFWK